MAAARYVSRLAWLFDSKLETTHILHERQSNTKIKEKAVYVGLSMMVKMATTALHSQLCRPLDRNRTTRYPIYSRCRILMCNPKVSMFVRDLDLMMFYSLRSLIELGWGDLCPQGGCHTRRVFWQMGFGFTPSRQLSFAPTWMPTCRGHLLISRQI